MEAFSAASAWAPQARAPSLTLASSCALDFDIGAFVGCLRSQATPDFVPGHCVQSMALALGMAGAVVAGHPQHARDWGPYLWRIGFRLVKCDSFRRYAAAAGDIAVIDGTGANRGGHVQGFDGAAWISDFIQAGFWPSAGYRRAEPGFEIYRPQCLG
jgi:hypothetical protein